MFPIVIKELEIPENVRVANNEGVITIEGPKGTLTRDFYHPKIKIEISEKNKIIISCKFASGKERALVGTFASHVSNMLKGVKEGFTYHMKVVYSHFPMKVSVKNNKLVIENFLGEKYPRKAKLYGDVKVIAKGETVTIEGINKEEVGQTAANIEYATRVKKRDIRVFQDGIYIVEKGA
jgi:large subunit ribosomal protein L6